MRILFHRFSSKVSAMVGSPFAFIFALGVIVVWAVSGPTAGYSDTWQLIINTSTTIVTFLMVFLIQNTQNRDSKALHIKLDELIKASKGARTSLVNIEEMEDEELEILHNEFKMLHEKAAGAIEKRKQSRQVEVNA